MSSMHARLMLENMTSRDWHTEHVVHGASGPPTSSTTVVRGFLFRRLFLYPADDTFELI